MAATHTFGGNWTEEKLSHLKKYLVAYRTIFTGNERARHFRTWYVDAFAGTGSRSDADRATTTQPLFEDVYRETTGYRDGSAKIALELPSPFDRYLFVEESKTRINELKSVVEEINPQLSGRCDFSQGDANAELKRWCQERDWATERAVVFLDPYGMQVDWTTVTALGATKAIDLWYLFPLGVGVARLLRRDGNISETWQKRLDLLFGTDEWRRRFYLTQTTSDLFGEYETVERDAPVEKIDGFITERLSTSFCKVAKGKILRNSKSSPLYLLCFAAANEKGAPTALRIAQGILKD
jgi:three-Cys-motif partner protein